MKIILDVDGDLNQMIDYINAINIDNDLINSITFEK